MLNLAEDFETKYNIPLEPKRKYSVACPECGPTRKKQGTKSVTVCRDPDGYIRWFCNHSDACPLSKRKWVKDPLPDDVRYEEDLYVVPRLSSIATVPETRDGNKLWWYKSDEGEPLYAVEREDLGSRKTYRPVGLQADATAVRLPHWPRIIGHYGQENLKRHGTILVVEGEKAADAAQRLFPEVAVITWRGGSKNLSTANWDRAELKDKKIYLWPDNDKDGQEAMSKIAALLSDSEVYIVETSDFPAGSDLADDLGLNNIHRAIKDAIFHHKPQNYIVSLEDIEEQDRRLGERFKIGWPIVDEKVSFPASGVVVLEGRTGHAKTGSAINIAANALRDGHTVHYFSYEIPASRVFTRFVRLHEVAGRPIEVADWIENKKLKIYDQSKQLPLKKLKEILDNPALQKSLVVLDYAQIVPCGGGEQRMRMIELMDTLRIAANTHGFLVLLLSQLTPDYSNPLFDAPREAKDIHFSAEMVLRVWNKDNEFGHPVYDDITGNLVIHVVKNRDGESGYLIGCNWTEGVYLEPNEKISKIGRLRKEENRSTKALETIADILKLHFGGI